MAYVDSNLNDPEKYFSATLYTGNATARTIATGHQSDLVWLKRRDGAAGHRIADSVRGATKLLYADSNTSEQTDSDSITGFVSTGFTLGDDGGGFDVNTNTNTMVAWSWKAGTSFTNDASATSVGSIDSAGSINTTAGISIIEYSGTGSQGTIAHGLQAKPGTLWFKRLDTTGNWVNYHQSIGATKYLRFDTNAAEITASDEFNDTEPTTSVFTVDTDGAVNASGTDNHIVYCFAEKQGFSKFGSYTGNGNADGPMIVTGMRPSFVLVKRTDGTDHWTLWDNKRESNPNNNVLYPSLTDAESTSDSSYLCDFLSNGIKWRGTSTGMNASGANYVYMAFAEAPFVNSKGVPCNAK